MPGFGHSSTGRLGDAIGVGVGGHRGLVLLNAFLDLVLPQRCVGCGRAGFALCLRCVPDVRVHLLRHGGLDVAAAAAYDDAVRRALIRYKERGRRDLAGPLAELLARAGEAAIRVGRAPPRTSLVLVPVPSTRTASAARGGNHLDRLARRAAARLGVRVAPDLLVHARAVLDSSGLGIAARELNMASALRARRGPVGPRAAVLVDDIVTTGATLREAHRALDAAGWPVLGAAVIAATPRRVDDRPRR